MTLVRRKPSVPVCSEEWRAAAVDPGGGAFASLPFAAPDEEGVVALGKCALIMRIRN